MTKQSECHSDIALEMKCAGSRSHIGSSALDRVDIAAAMAVATAAAVIILIGLGGQSLANWDEAIYGVVARELLSRPGLTLYYEGQPWFEKPPFLFWLMAGSASFLGMTEFALRLPTALFGIATIVLQYFAGRRLGGRLTGLAAAILLLGVPQFVAYSRLAMMDVPLTALGMLSFVLLLYSDKQTLPAVLAGIAFGLAILTKSAAAFLFVPGFIALALAWHGPSFLWSKALALAAALTLAIALPWHVWAALSYGRSFVGPYFFFHIVHRFAQPMEGHEGDYFYYFDLYLHNAGLLALVHAAGIALAIMLAIRQRNSWLTAVTILPVGSFLIVSLQQTKIGWYLTPVYPGAALATAVALGKLLRDTKARATAVVLASLLALPGTINGRGVFVETYNILDYSPEIRSLRNSPPFVKGRMPVLYTLGVAEPAARFYLADHVESLDQAGLERLLAEHVPFLCLMFRSQVTELLNNHPQANLKIIASTESLAVITSV